MRACVRACVRVWLWYVYYVCKRAGTRRAADAPYLLTYLTPSPPASQGGGGGGGGGAGSSTVTSKISKFGVGGIHAGFFIGKAIKVVTSTKVR